MNVARDAELVALTILRAAMPGVRAGTITPPDMPDEFVRVRRIGGGMEGRVRDAARLDVLVSAPDEAAAMALALRVRAVLLESPGTRTGGAVVYGVAEVMGPQRFPNPDDLDKSLVMFTHEVTLRTEHHQ